jgi:flagella basal body P-ring formation protein FlgA
MKRALVAVNAPLALMTATAVFATLLLLVVASVRAEAQPSVGVAARDTAGTLSRGMVRVTWPKATRALQRGDIVGAGDFVLADTVIVWRVSSVQPDTTRAIIGWMTHRTIAPGEFIRPPSVAPAPVVTLGAPVKVLFQDGAVRLTLTGTATTNAALGASVGVRLDKTRRLDGIAVGANLVRIR